MRIKDKLSTSIDSSDSNEKVGIAELLEKLVSHMNSTRKLYLLLILSAFIMAPMSIISAVILISPQIISEAGVNYVITASPVDYTQIPPIPAGIPRHMTWAEGQTFDSVIVELKPFEVLNFSNGNWVNVSQGEFNVELTGKLVTEPLNHQMEPMPPSIALSYIAMNESNKNALMVYKSSPAVPRFMVITDNSQFNRQTDVSGMIFAFIAISIVISSVWLFVGFKEFRFFSKWNNKFRKFRTQKEQIDKELDDTE